MPVPAWELLAALALFSLAVCGVAAAAAHAVLSRAVPEGGPTPPVSILKPLCGLDDGLYENLVSFCNLDYPEYELLLAAEDPNDPALDLALRVKRQHPERAITVVVVRGSTGRNPKVRILRELARRARHPWLLISDSNVRVRPSYLRDTAGELRDPRVRLVTNPVVGHTPRNASLGSLFEALHLAGFVLPATALPRVLIDRACVIGKSMLLHRGALEAVGGFRSVSNVLAEDYLLGRKLERRGWKVALSPHVVQTVVATWPVERFLNRHVRWAQMRRRLSLGAYVGELLLQPVPFALAALCALPDVGPRELLFAALVVAGKVALDARVATHLRGRPLPFATLAWIPVKDVLVAALWPVALLRRTLQWRATTLRIGRCSRLFAAPDATPAADPLEAL